MNFRKHTDKLNAYIGKTPAFLAVITAAIAILIAFGIVFLINGQYKEVNKSGIIMADENKQIEAAVDKYFLNAELENKGSDTVFDKSNMQGIPFYTLRRLLI